MADPKEVLDVLIKARATILDPEHWTQGTYARNQAGEPVEWDSPNAVCFCSLGTIAKETTVEFHGVRAVNDKLYDRAKGALFAWLMRKQIVIGGVPNYNDSVTHTEVIQMFDGAIAMLQETPC